MWNRAPYKIQQTEGYYYIKQLFYWNTKRACFCFSGLPLAFFRLTRVLFIGLKVTDNLHTSTNFISGQIEVMLMD